MPIEIVTGLLVLIGTLIGNLASFWIQRMIIRGEKSNHISKVRFDTEFEIYQELSENNLEVVHYCQSIDFYYDNYIGLLDLMYSEDNGISDTLNKFMQKIIQADLSNKKYAPFIDKTIYESYNSLIEKAKDLHELMEKYRLFEIHQTIRYNNKSLDKEEAVKLITNNKKELIELSDKILDELRDYLKSLDVKEK